MTTAPLTAPVVLLDLDGTVVDSAPGILAGLDRAFAACGEEKPAPDVLRTFIGPPLSECFEGVLGMTPERSEAMRRAYVAYYDVEGYTASVPYPGMPELIRALAADGRTVAVATNKPEPIATALLEHVGIAGDLALIGGTDRAVGRSDKAAVIGSVLERLGESRAVMVGDRLHDAHGAAVHGLPTVLVGWGYGGEAEEAHEGPRAASVQELSGLLRG
ncbi:HAD hydrolase-like protein [Brachybacterium sp. DNPG3]